MPDQMITVNLHSPRVQKIQRHDTGVLAVTLGNDSYASHVNVFTNDAEWAELVAEVQLWLIAEKLAQEKTA